MIELPDHYAPSAARVALVDFGFVQRPALGGAMARINRPGSRFQIELSWPPMRADDARVLIRRLTAAKAEGLRVLFPLQGVSQGEPGASVVVDGGGAAGTSLPLRGLTPHYAVKEGWWLTAIDADDNRYLHQVAAPAAADGTGDVVLTVTPMLRAPLADGDVVLLAAPTVEGVVIEDIGWEQSPGALTSGIGCVIEEAA